MLAASVRRRAASAAARPATCPSVIHTGSIPFHETIHGEAAILTGVDVERVLTDCDRLAHPWRSLRGRIHREVVLRDDGAAFNAAALPHVDLPRPVVRAAKLPLVQTEPSEALANGSRNARIVLRKPNKPRDMIDMKCFQALTMVARGFRPRPVFAGNVDAGKRLNISVHLEFAARQ